MNKKLKKIRTTTITTQLLVLVSLCAILIGFTVLFSSCEFLQSTLSSTQQEKLLEATGSPRYDYKGQHRQGLQRCTAADRRGADQGRR